MPLGCCPGMCRRARAASERYATSETSDDDDDDDGQLEGQSRVPFLVQNWYLIPYDNDEQRERVLDVLALHNRERGPFCDESVRYTDEHPYEQLAVGAPIEQAKLVTFKPGRAFRSPHKGPSLAHAVLLRQRGDRAATATFLRWHLLRAVPEAYVDGAHAVDVYAHDARMLARFAQGTTRARVPDARIGLPPRARGGGSADAAAAFAVVREARWTTRFWEANEAYEELLEGLGAAARRAHLQELNMHTWPPGMASYETATSGLVVLDRTFATYERADAEAFAAESNAAAALLPSDDEW